MTDEELNKELKEAVENQDKLAHVETRTTQSEVDLKLKCQECSEIQDFLVCDDQQMELSEDGTTLTCIVEGCGKTLPVPQHHGKNMVPFVVKA